MVEMLVSVFNRPPPPLPDLYLSEEVVNEIAGFIRSHINALLSTSKDIALGKDTRMFFRVAAYMCLLSVIGGFTDFLTLGYTSKFHLCLDFHFCTHFF